MCIFPCKWPTQKDLEPCNLQWLRSKCSKVSFDQFSSSFLGVNNSTMVIFFAKQQPNKEYFKFELFFRFRHEHGDTFTLCIWDRIEYRLNRKNDHFADRFSHSLPTSQDKFCRDRRHKRETTVYVPFLHADKRSIKAKTNSNRTSTNDRCRLKSTSVSDYIRFYWMRCLFFLFCVVFSSDTIFFTGFVHVIRCVCDSGSPDGKHLHSGGL